MENTCFSSSNNILYIPSTIDQNILDDKMAYFVNYLYTYPFKYKERVKMQVMSQKISWNGGSEDPGILNNSDHQAFYSNVSGAGSLGKFSGYPSSYVVTSDNYYELWDGFVPIYSQKMRDIITSRSYRYVRDKLLENEIIKCNWSYSNYSSTGKYTMRYAINDLYRFSPLSYYELTSPRFVKKVNALNSQRRNDLIPVLQALEDKLFLIEFDHISASNFVATQKYKGEASKFSRIGGIWVMKDKSPLHYNIYESPKVRRVFSPVTSLPRDLRPFITYNNQILWDADVSCCLPTLFNIHLKDLNDEDVQLYRYLTCDNQEDFGLYEYLIDLWGINDREKVKELTMVIFFGKETTIRNLRKKFSSEFPTVYQTMQFLKRNDYKFLATNLMRLERQIMIDTVARNLLQDVSDMILLTIHDGILTTEEYVGETKLSIQNAIQDVIGFKPKVKFKPLIE